MQRCLPVVVFPLWGLKALVLTGYIKGPHLQLSAPGCATEVIMPGQGSVLRAGTGTQLTDVDFKGKRSADRLLFYPGNSGYHNLGGWKRDSEERGPRGGEKEAEAVEGEKNYL